MRLYEDALSRIAYRLRRKKAKKYKERKKSQTKRKRKKKTLKKERIYKHRQSPMNLMEKVLSVITFVPVPINMQ